VRIVCSLPVAVCHGTGDRGLQGVKGRPMPSGKVGGVKGAPARTTHKLSSAEDDVSF